jgi:RNA polymerase sigma-70 factor (ECF subfamily)
MLTHRRAVDRVRTEQRRRTTQLGPQDDRPDETPTPDVQALTALLGEQARQALAALTHVKREALVLSYWGGYTQPEIAILTGAPVGTVKTRMHHALKDLKATLSTQPVGERRHDAALPG